MQLCLKQIARSTAIIIFLAVFGVFIAPAGAQTDKNSVLDQLEPSPDASAKQGKDGITTFTLKTTNVWKIQGATEYKTPIIITAVAKTDSTNIRLFFGDKGLIIFNWEENGKTFQYFDPRTGERKQIANKGAVPVNTWVTIRWILNEKQSRILVDGVERASFDGDYSGLSGKVGFGANTSANIAFKSIKVTSAKDKVAVSRSDEDLTVPIEIEVPTSQPSNNPLKPLTAAEAAAAVDPNVIERPQYQNRAKALTKNISSVKAMMVRIADDGTATGVTSDIIGTIQSESRRAEKSGIGFIRQDGDAATKTSLEEAVRAIQLRYPIWEAGHIDLSFGEKFTGHGGPSMGTAFGILMLSMLEGTELDNKCAVTGDITVDWKVRKVGGVTAKIRGAILEKCAYACIPEGNETAFADMALIYGKSSLWNIQVFSVSTLQDAFALTRKDRAASLVDAMKIFEEIKSEFVKNEEAATQSIAVRKSLKRVLELAPNHLSAKYLLEHCDGTNAKTLSANATLYQISIILYPFRMALSTGNEINRSSLPAALAVSARKRIETLRPIADKDLLPLLKDLNTFIAAMDGFASKNASAETLKTAATNLDSRFTSISRDSDFVDKLIHEGY